MRECISIQYDASTASFLVRTPAVKVVPPLADGEEDVGHTVGAAVPQLGVPEPTARIQLAELPEDVRAAFRVLEAALIPATEAKFHGFASDPKAAAEKAQKLAADEQRIEAEKLAHEEAMVQKQAEAAALDAEIAKKRAELANGASR